ncbi:Transcription repressor OFP17 [Rhynchospora pubera]|uniref:Transcription repressor OFP17 n=1 Tax=Rhynchospora pubera TaxID=906938 RepID=A0AAV8HJX8_9POAL|nr:Transcription repressor OFP17 [Rhynchospora pubera]
MTPHPRTSSYTKRKQARPTLVSSYNKMAAQIKKVEEKNTIEDDEVQKACRNFEKYIMEMILEERKVRDLLDVEELMYCMDKLQAPAFIELVCTFYGELCVDLFSNSGDQPVLEAGAN